MTSIVIKWLSNTKKKQKRRNYYFLPSSVQYLNTHFQVANHGEMTTKTIKSSENILKAQKLTPPLGSCKHHRVQLQIQMVRAKYFKTTSYLYVALCFLK